MAERVRQVYVNGHFVGGQGAADSTETGAFTALSGWAVPADLLTPGDNVIAIHFKSLVPGYDGINDSRVYLGPAVSLQPFLLRATMLENLFADGPVYLLLFVAALLIALIALEESPALRARYMVVLGMAASCWMYLAMRSGIITSLFFSVPARVMLTPLAVILSFYFLVEFTDSWYLSRSSWMGWLSRRMVPLMLVGWLAAMPFGTYMFKVYTVYSLYFLGAPLYMAYVTLRQLFHRPTGMQLILGCSIVVVAICGFLDIATDLHAIHLPRLAHLAVSGTVVLASVVVIGDFITISNRNKDLSRSLKASNENLSTALVAAEESSRVKGQFLASVSHELRTPLNSIINVPEGLLEEFQRKTIHCDSCSRESDADDGAAPLGAYTPCPSCGVIGQLREVEVCSYRANPGKRPGTWKSSAAAARTSWAWSTKSWTSASWKRDR